MVVAKYQFLLSQFVDLVSLQGSDLQRRRRFFISKLGHGGDGRGIFDIWNRSQGLKNRWVFNWFGIYCRVGENPRLGRRVEKQSSHQGHVLVESRRIDEICKSSKCPLALGNIVGKRRNRNSWLRKCL